MDLSSSRRAALLAAGLLAACSSTPPAKTEAPPAPPPQAAQAPKPAPAPASVAPAQAAPAPMASALPPYLDPHNPLYSDRSVYFAFDRSDVDTQGNQTIVRNGEFLATAARVKVRVEGNCDERGGAEYNLALGQRRAEAVAARLRSFGVKNSQLDVVSYGKEHPRAAGHDEAAWRQNRRADIAYPSS